MEVEVLYDRKSTRPKSKSEMVYFFSHFACYGKKEKDCLLKHKCLKKEQQIGKIQMTLKDAESSNLTLSKAETLQNHFQINSPTGYKKTLISYTKSAFFALQVAQWVKFE